MPVLMNVIFGLPQALSNLQSTCLSLGLSLSLGSPGYMTDKPSKSGPHLRRNRRSTSDVTGIRAPRGMDIRPTSRCTIYPNYHRQTFSSGDPGIRRRNTSSTSASSSRRIRSGSSSRCAPSSARSTLASRAAVSHSLNCGYSVRQNSSSI